MVAGFAGLAELNQLQLVLMRTQWQTAKSTFMLHLKYTIEFFGASRSTKIIKLGIYSEKGFHSKIYLQIWAAGRKEIGLSSCAEFEKYFIIGYSEQA